MRPRFLSRAMVVEIHRDQITRYGASLGLRDEGLLDSAIAAAAARFGNQYLHAFPHEMAAAYLFHLVSNHAFVDGNKRVGTVAALVFLKLNGVRYRIDKAQLESMVLRVASGNAEKADVTLFFRDAVVTP